MSFKVDKTEEFLSTFKAHKQKNKNFNGCNHLELLKDIKDPSIYFTYSYWKDEESLETYRKSKLFKSVWAKTKVLFKDKPKAWSTEMLDPMNE